MCLYTILDITENIECHQRLPGLPKHVAAGCMLCLGWPAEPPKIRAKPRRL